MFGHMWKFEKCGRFYNRGLYEIWGESNGKNSVLKFQQADEERRESVPRKEKNKESERKMVLQGAVND